MDFDTFMAQAWKDHADQPDVVAQRLREGTALVADEGQLVLLMNLAHHVHGEHLGNWRAGIAFIDGLAELAPYAADGPSGQARARFVVALELSAGSEAGFAGLSISDRIRVGALAAANLGRRDTTRALQLLQEALALAQRAGLAASDPMNRALAVSGNNLAMTLELQPTRSAEERELMILAAQTGRQFWGIAGTWLETERAEYRLAMTWLQAGDRDRAREHARACLQTIEANRGAAIERLFGWEALGLVERAAGNAAAHAQALAGAREAFDEVDEDDKAWCAESIEKLAA
jgi:hypothetical protein